MHLYFSTSHSWHFFSHRATGLSSLRGIPIHRAALAQDPSHGNFGRHFLTSSAGPAPSSAQSRSRARASTVGQPNHKAARSHTETAVSYAATSQNWNAALFLLQRGATWKQYRTPDGLTLKDMAESNLRLYGDKPGLHEVIHFLSR